MLMAPASHPARWVRSSDSACVLRLRLAATLGALGAFLEARREAQPTATALGVFDAAAETLRAGTRPHRLFRTVLARARIAQSATSADAGEALLATRGPLHALASTEFGPREHATAKTVGLLRKALAAPADPLAELPPAAITRPLSDLDGALRRFAGVIPALTRCSAQPRSSRTKPTSRRPRPFLHPDQRTPATSPHREA
jgi:hypothetical protein